MGRKDKRCVRHDILEGEREQKAARVSKSPAAAQTHSSVVNTSMTSSLLRPFRVAHLACRITRRGRSRCLALASITPTPPLSSRPSPLEESAARAKAANVLVFVTFAVPWDEKSGAILALLALLCKRGGCGDAEGNTKVKYIVK